MNTIEIPFNAWSLVRLQKGIKNSTWRSKAYGGQSDIFHAAGKTYQLIYVIGNIPACDVISSLWRLEGADGPEELETILRGIKRGHYNPLALGFLHIFREIKI
jgi:hypothetical protein